MSVSRRGMRVVAVVRHARCASAACVLAVSQTALTDDTAHKLREELSLPAPKRATKLGNINKIVGMLDEYHQTIHPVDHPSDKCGACGASMPWRLPGAKHTRTGALSPCEARSHTALSSLLRRCARSASVPWLWQVRARSGHPGLQCFRR